MNKSKIVLIALGFIVLCLAYYCLVPKYEMHTRTVKIPHPGPTGPYPLEDKSGIEITRFNRITGRIDVKRPGATWEIGFGRFLNDSDMQALEQMGKDRLF